MLRYDSVRQAHLLLLPERVVRLNDSGAAILTRCDGTATVAEVVADLETEFELSGLADDVTAFLDDAVVHGWVVT
ncbi:MAG: pyrroloquinoline quinone biosynthesis peptide chaperone PqqD [Propionibacteriales bacterium]|nr:pyrroloquinoline quinone biosynthesis peptide chaperone PqqD [Propionibacteriales bacterium]